MALIERLAPRWMMASMASANQPANDRLVILQDLEKSKVMTTGVRYRSGRWIGETSGDDLTNNLSTSAIWMETVLVVPSAGPTAISRRKVPA